MARRCLSPSYHSVTLRVQIPAVVVEPRRVGDRSHVVERQLLELPESDDDVGHLHAGVVDVVLRLDRRAAETQGPHQRVAERGVAQVADVRGLVRVDRRVLDDGFLASVQRRRHLLTNAGGEERSALDDTGSGSRSASRRRGRCLECRRAPGRAPARCFAAPCAAMRASWNATGTARSPRARVGRHFDGEGRHIGDAELFPDRLADGVVNVSLKAENHVRIACEQAPRRAKLVIRLQFVTLERLEIRVVGRRVHVREQPIRIAESADLLDGHDARAHVSRSSTHLQATLRKLRRCRRQARATCRPRTTDDSRVRSRGTTMSAPPASESRCASSGDDRYGMSQATSNSASPRAAVSAACSPPSGPHPGTRS